MKYIALLVLCSCSFYSEPSEHPTDAAIDSPAADAPSPPKGCAVMGNLPYARSINIATGDQVPAALIDELQDLHVGDKRTIYNRMAFPRQLGGTGWGALADVTAGGVTRAAITSTGATSDSTFQIDIESGERLLGFSVFACGNGVTDLSGSVNYVPSFLTDSGAFGLFSLTANNTPAAWTEVVGVVLTPAIAAGAGSFIVMAPDVNGAAYSLSMMKLTLDRP